MLVLGGAGTFIFHQEPRVVTYTAVESSGENQLVNLFILPDPNLTPGAYDTLDVNVLTQRFNGKTYSEENRDVTQATKIKIYKLHGIAYPQPRLSWKIDHLWPVCAGGSDDVSNLWPRPQHVYYQGRDLGYRTKDEMEAYICRHLDTIDLADAFHKVTTNWVAYYDEIMPKK